MAAPFISIESKLGITLFVIYWPLFFVSLKSRSDSVVQHLPVQCCFGLSHTIYHVVCCCNNTANDNNSRVHLSFSDLQLEHHQLVCDVTPNRDFCTVIPMKWSMLNPHSQPQWLGWGFPRWKVYKLFTHTVLVQKRSCNLILTVLS